MYNNKYADQKKKHVVVEKTTQDSIRVWTIFPHFEIEIILVLSMVKNS